MNKTILLSILIPSYCYAEGVERILGRLGNVPADVEILIFDDSPQDEIGRRVLDLELEGGHIGYRHNPTVVGTSLGPGRNWNSLLESASGEYVLLMHHDEFPLTHGFIEALRPHLTKGDRPDVLLLGLKLLCAETRSMRDHVPSWLRWTVPLRTPRYLFRRNVIGPTAGLVIRREITPRFDPKLVWLIDVDFYYQLCLANLDWREVREVSVGSLLRNEGTITASLSGTLSTVGKLERQKLRRRYPRSGLWLGSCSGAPIRWLEASAWGIFRLLFQTKNLLFARRSKWI